MSSPMTGPGRGGRFGMGPALLFCPADRPERYAKAAARADAVILDLEDAVAPDSKAEARTHLRESTLDPARTIVRISRPGTADSDLDLEVLRQTGYRTVMAAKVQGPDDCGRLEGFDVIALCETATGVVNAAAIAASPNVVALMWGAEDLMASLGGTSSRRRDGRYREVARHARSTVLLAARAAGKAAVDAVYVDIADIAGLRTEADDAVASGFAAKACIHPAQAAAVREAYRPDADAVAAARALLNAAEGEGGVFSFNGKMVDEPILLQARETLRRAAL